MHTIAETHDYLKQAEKLGLKEIDRAKIALELASNPNAGQSLGGGLFKLRVPRKGQGKSGSFRVVYFYKPIDAPIFLLSIFAKNKKDNLSPNEKQSLVSEARLIAKGE